MLSKLANVFKIPDLRKKILFTLFVIVLYRLGSHITVPGVDFDAVRANDERSGAGGALALLNLTSGGGFTRFALFGLGIMPYITASIIIQLMGVVIPKLAQWREEGATGQKKITQATRYLTIVLAMIQATGFAALMKSPTGRERFGLDPNVPLFVQENWQTIALIVFSITVGTVLVMWLGELVTQRGIGQGMSIIIFVNVVSTLPVEGTALFKEAGSFKFGIIVAISLLLLVAIVYVEQGQRRIPVQYPKRVVGRRMSMGQNTYIPLKVNLAGVIAIIFASSVLYLPTLIRSVVPWTGVQTFIDNHIIKTTSPVHLAIYGFLIILFSYFYTAIAFNPQEQANNIRKQGGYIPGIRPGPPTEAYLQYILNRTVLPGALFIAFVALLPNVALSLFDVSQYPFAGTTLLIAVGVALETMKQIDAQLMMRNYEGFLKK